MQEYVAYKYSQRGKGELHEAIILAGKPVFLKYDREDSQFKIVEKIREGNRVIRPPYPEEYPYEPYAFSIFEEIPAVAAQAKEATIDSLYQEAKKYVNEYNEQDDLKLTLNAVDIIFSYFQDRFATTHYDNIVGDNDSGKSSIGITVEATAYRPVYMTDPSAANIFRCLGTIEPGQGTIIIDEADKIDKSPEMMAILKTGYQLNGKVPKINSNTLKQEFFYTYALKWIISERSMGLNEAKGVYDRTFSFTTYPGDSQFDIKETLNPQGNSVYRIKLNHILHFRNLMLIYRLIHYKDSVSDIDIGLRRRNKELCKPILQLFCNVKPEIQKQIISMLEHFLKAKRQRKANTIDASLYTIVKDLLSSSDAEAKTKVKKKNELPTSLVWGTIIQGQKIEGYYDPKRPNEYQTADFGTIYRNSISKIICDKFGAIVKHKEQGNILIFDIAKLARVGKSYELNSSIRVTFREDAEGSERSEGGAKGIPITEECLKTEISMNVNDDFKMLEQNSNRDANNIIDKGQKLPTPSSDHSDPSERSAEEKSKDLEHYSCKYCEFGTYLQTEYDHHTVFKHPRKAGY